MRSAKFEFVWKKTKAENRILNDFTFSILQIKTGSYFQVTIWTISIWGRQRFTFMLEDNSTERKVISHCYNFLLFFLTYQLTSWTSPRATHSKVMRAGISRLIKWIALFKITRKGWSLTSTVFKTRERYILKKFKIKTDRKLPRVQRNPEWRLRWENFLARFEPVPHMRWQQNSAKAKATTLRPNLALKTG